MSKLYFKVASDWEEVVRLRNEIAKLKQELKGMDSTQSPAAFKALNTQLLHPLNEWMNWLLMPLKPVRSWRGISRRKSSMLRRQ